VDRLTCRIADPADFDAIHRLNYATFVEEIPQHAPNDERRLVDRLHDENTYVICMADERLVGMVCGRCERPFSLDAKLADLDGWLPAHRKVVEIRLLAVAREYRKTAVFRELVSLLSTYFLARGCDLAVISGTVRELRLYRHLGFEPFGAPVGTGEALYQPMFLTLDAFMRNIPASRGMAAYA
jgi:GNAT superfamily N-acetyltransferase